MPTDDAPPGAELSEIDACETCPIAPTRRAFLRDAGAAALAAFITLGVSRAAAAQLPIGFTRAIARSMRTRSYAIPATDGAQIDRKEEVIVVRSGNALYAFNLSCPHQHTALRWDTAAHRFQCPKHKSRYEVDGTFIDGRATRGMDRFKISREGGNIVVDLDMMYRQDTDAAGWTGAVIHLT